MATDKEIQEYGLMRARSAMLQNDDENAKKDYAAVASMDEKNLEATWFVTFFETLRELSEQNRREGIELYKALGGTFILTLKTVDKENRIPVGIIMQKSFTSLSTKLMEIADVFYPVHILEPYKEICENILDVLGDSPDAITLAVDTWENAIYMRHKYCVYRNAQDKNKETWYDKLIKQIQKYDPSYEAPQFEQAGCLMTGEKAREAAKVKPGK